MATVWRAEDEALGRQVAVKVLLPFVAERPEAGERFAREARALAGIRHPNVLQLFDYLPALGEEPARLIMELLQGPSLHRFVVDAGAPLPEVAALVGAEVAAGLGAVHARGIVHRDVKPENVLLDGGRVVLTDFGVARVQLAERSALTQTGAIIGSPAYMSPEQARGEEVDVRSDQFSLGSLLYFLSTGAAPFSGPHPLVVMQKIDHGDYQPAGAKNPRVPAWLDRIIRRCLARDPAARFPDASSLAEALLRGLADDGLADPGAELKRYFADPPAYNAGLPERIVPVRLADAEAALARGDRTRALASIERVLQLDPRHERALVLFERSSRRTGRRLLQGVGVALLAFALAAPLAWMRWHAGPQRAPVSSVASLPPSPPTETAIGQPPAVRAPVPDPPVPDPPKPEHPRPVRVAKTASAPSFPVESAPIAAPRPVEVVSPPLERAPTTGQLTVHTAPWCELAVDGKPVGRTPQSLTLAAGPHRLACENPSGARFERSVELAAGETQRIEERLTATAELRPSLHRGDALAIDGASASRAARTVSVGRHRVSLLSAGQVLDARWLDVPAAGCRLSDTPDLHCENP